MSSDFVIKLYGHKTVKDVAYDLYNRFQEKIDAGEVNLQSIKLLYEQENEPPIIAYDPITNRVHLLVFSAQNREGLLKILHKVADHLKKCVDESSLIAILEFELMSIRRPDKVRLAIIARDNQELLAEINHFISGQDSNYIYVDEIENKTDGITMFASCNDAKTFLRNSFYDGSVKKIAALWSLGIEIDWSIFTNENKHGIVIIKSG